MLDETRITRSGALKLSAMTAVGTAVGTAVAAVAGTGVSIASAQKT